MLSGVVFGGLLGVSLLRSLVRAGVVPMPTPLAAPRRSGLIVLAGATGLAIAAGIYLFVSIKGPPEVAIRGDVDAPFSYSQAMDSKAGLANVEVVEREKPGLIGTYRGVRLRDLVSRAAPRPGTSAVLIKGSDGYDFFVGLGEVTASDSLILARVTGPKGDSFSVVGAENSKAWVRNVVAIEIVTRAIVEVSGALQRPYPFVPDDWQKQMDNAQLDLGFGVRKYQGVPLGVVLERMSPAPGASLVRVSGAGDQTDLPLANVLATPAIRLYSYSTETGLAVALAEETGRVLVRKVERIAVR